MEANEKQEIVNSVIDGLETIILEYTEKARQSGKSETSGLVMELKQDMKSISKAQIQTNEHLKSIDDHLGRLNSKVATNVSNIAKNQLRIENIEKGNIEKFINLDAVYEDYRSREKAIKTNYGRIVERIMWILAIISLFVLVKVGLLAPELVDKIL